MVSKNSAYLADHVLAAVRIRDTQRALGIITPFPIDNESVGVLSGQKIDSRAPSPFASFLHRNGALLPMGEVSGEHHTRSSGRGEAKCLFPGSFDLPSHSLF